MKPVLLDYAGHFTYLDSRAVVLTKKDKWIWDTGVIKELIDNADFFFGCDSGPAHIAAATDTPSYIIWIDSDPLQVIDPAPNLTHWIRSLRYCETEQDYADRDYFEKYYPNECYGDSLESWLGGLKLADEDINKVKEG